MTILDTRQRVKAKFNIPDSVITLDQEVDDCIADAVEALSPFYSNSDTVTGIEVSSADSAIVTPDGSNGLPISSINNIWFNTTESINGSARLTGYQYNDTLIRFTQPFPQSGFLTIDYKQPAYIEVDVASPQDSAIIGIGQQWVQPFLNYCYAELAAFLANNGSAYNVYSQQSGARSVDNLLNLSSFYEGRANTQLTNIESST